MGNNISDLKGTSKTSFGIGLKKWLLDAAAATVLRTMTLGDRNIDFGSGVTGDVLQIINSTTIGFGAGGGGGGGPTTGTQAVANNQTSAVDVVGFLVDKTLHNGFAADVSVNREVTASGLVGVQQNGVNQKVNYMLNVGGGSIVVGNFNKGVYKINYDGTFDTAFMNGIGSGFAGGEVLGVLSVGMGNYIFFGSFTSYNGNTRNRICKIDSSGNEDTNFYDTLGIASGGSGFNGTVTLVKTGLDASPSLIGAYTIAGSFTTLNGSSVGNWIQVADNNGGLYSYNSSFFYVGTPKDIISDLINGGLYIAGISTSGVNPSRKMVYYANTSTNCEYTQGTGFDDDVLSLCYDPTSQGIIVAGKFGNYNGSSAPKLVRLLDTAGPFPTGNLDGTFLPLANTSGNYVNYAYSPDSTNIYFCGKFNDFTSQNVCAVDSSGAEYTAWTSSLGSGFTNPIDGISINDFSTGAVIGNFYGEAAVPSTLNVTYGYVSSQRKAELYRINGAYNNSLGYLTATINLVQGDNFGVTLSFDGPSGQLKYTSSYLPTNTGEIRWSLTSL